MKRPTVFISYSWDSKEHQDWVLKLATDLITKYNIDVILDQFEINAGNDLTYFMETSIEKSNKVLLILTPNYKLKAEDRNGGVGYETSIISQELFESPITNIKFIPILREGNSSTSTPKFIKSKVHHPMTINDEYITKLYELGRILNDKPKLEKPKFGKTPDFSKSESDPLIELANKITNEEEINLKLDRIIDSREGVIIASKDITDLYTNLNDRTVVYKNNTSLHFNFETDNGDESVISCGGYSVSFHLSNRVVNSSSDTKLKVRYWKGFFSLKSYKTMYAPGHEPKVVKTYEYRFDLDLDTNPIWKFKSAKYTKGDIANNSFAFIMESIRNEISKKFR